MPENYDVRRVQVNYTIQRLLPCLARAPRYCLCFYWYSPFLLAYDGKAQWPPRLRDYYFRVPPPCIDDSFLPSPAACLRSGMPVVVVDTPSQRLPKFDSVAAFSS